MRILFQYAHDPIRCAYIGTGLEVCESFWGQQVGLPISSYRENQIKPDAFKV
jgi:hypothetical protein